MSRELHKQMRHSYVNVVLALKRLHLKNYGNVSTNTLFISKCKHRDSLDAGHVRAHCSHWSTGNSRALHK